MTYAGCPVWALCVALCLIETTTARPQQAYEIHLPAESVANALTGLSEQVGVAVVFPYDLVKDRMSHPVNGRYTLVEALSVLLAGTGLSGGLSDQGVLTISTAESRTHNQGETLVTQNRNVSSEQARTSSSLGIGAFFTSLAAAFSAHSQVAPGQSGPNASDSLSEVIVTAQRKSEALADVPAAITVLDSSTLVENHALRLDDYFATVPGLAILDNGQGNMLLAIRGLTTGQANTPTVGVYIDETPITPSTQAAFGDLVVPDLDPTTLKQIEVIKGPQGTLYGANSLGGLIKYETLKPDSTAFSGNASIDGVDIPGHSAGGAVRAQVNLPLVSDQLAIRLSGFTRDDPGFISDPTYGLTNVNVVHYDGGRVALRWTPTDALTLDLSALGQTRHAAGSNNVDFDYDTNAPAYGPLDQIRVPGTDVDTERLELFNATLTAKLGWGTFVSSTSYSDSRLNGNVDLSLLFTPVAAEVYSLNNVGVPEAEKFSTSKFTQEDRLSGSAGPVDWVGGLFFTHESNDVYQHFGTIDATTGAPITLPDFYTYTFISQYIEYAGFGDVTYNFTPSFDVQAGVRYSENHQLGDQINSGEINVTNNIISKYSGGALTYLVTPTYKLTNDSLLYAKVATGYRAGGPNTATDPGITPTYEPDKTTDYEIGTKVFGLNRTLYVDLSLYHIDWKNIQLLVLDQYNNNYTTNGGEAVSQGAEIAVTYKPIESLTLSGNVSNNDAHLTKNAPSTLYAPAGSRLPYGARYTANGSVEYGREVANGYRLTVGADAQYQGVRYSEFTRDAEEPRFRQPSYYVANMHLRVDHGPYSVTMYVRNFADAYGIISAGHESLTSTGDYDLVLVPPRTVGITLAARF